MVDSGRIYKAGVFAKKRKYLEELGVLGYSVTIEKGSRMVEVESSSDFLYNPAMTPFRVDGRRYGRVGLAWRIPIAIVEENQYGDIVSLEMTRQSYILDEEEFFGMISED